MTEPRQSSPLDAALEKDGGEAALENAARFPLSHRTATAGILGKEQQPLNPVA
jgi:hypothetical protein